MFYFRYLCRSRSYSPISRKSHNSRSPASKKSLARAPSPPTPPRIRRHSPIASVNKSKRSRCSTSPSNGVKYSLSPMRGTKHRLPTPSPPRASKFSIGKSSSPVNKYRLSPQHSPRNRYKVQSPEIQKKHRHKHKY